jgi:hypothetical protein
MVTLASATFDLGDPTTNGKVPPSIQSNRRGEGMWRDTSVPLLPFACPSPCLLAVLQEIIAMTMRNQLSCERTLINADGGSNGVSRQTAAARSSPRSPSSKP